MNASKEACRSARSHFRKLLHDYNVQESESVETVLRFFDLAERKLPYESSFVRDVVKRAQKVRK